MAKRTTVHRFEPDYAVAPGGTLAETLSIIGMSQADLARRAGLSPKHVSQIISGDAAISADTAVRLERVTGVSGQMWSSLEAQYRTQLARLEEREELERNVGWLKSLPVRELVRRGAFESSDDKPTLVERALGFFGVTSVAAWNTEWTSPQAAFRRSQRSVGNPGAVAAWIRLGEIEARRASCNPYSEAAFRDALHDARALTNHGPEVFEPGLREICAKAGVAIVFVREIAKAPVSGATRWLSPHKAMIAISLRYRSNDQFWFSFFHEAGHVILHSKREGFVDVPGVREGDGVEDEANEFAASILIPLEHTARLRTLRSAAAVRAFAAEIGIHPGIVVGRLQHEGIVSHAALNHLKMRLMWSDTD